MSPLPRWRFLLKNSALWTVFGLSLLLGSISVCMVLESFSRHWEVYAHLKGSLSGFLLISFPYLWALLLVSFLALGYWDWRMTRGSYRRKSQLVLGASVVGAVILGGAGHALGLGYNFNRVMRHAMPAYRDLYEKKELEIWNKPQLGTLSGEIRQVEEGAALLEDPDGRTWEVRCPACEEKLRQKKDGMRRVKMVGERDGEERFVAKDLREWGDEEREEESEQAEERKKEGKENEGAFEKKEKQQEDD